MFCIKSGLLTGCYPNRIGISGALFPHHKIGINSQETTLAEMLKAQGYKTAIFGKWHLGHQPEFLPNNHGFDEFKGYPTPTICGRLIMKETKCLRIILLQGIQLPFFKTLNGQRNSEHWKTKDS